MAVQSGILGTAALPAEEERETLTVHWRAVFAGVFIAGLVYIILMSLGLAIGATGLQKVIEDGGQLGSLGKGAGVWAMLSVLISLFVGSYASGRVSGIVATRVGSSQGAVIASFFFIMMLSQIGLSVGLVGLGLGGLTSNIAGGVKAAAENPRVQEVVEDSLGDLSFHDNTATVISGLMNRLQNDNESAINYLASEAGLSTGEASARLRLATNRIQTALTDIAKQTATAAQFLGWSAFATFVLGSLAALIGGGLGAQINMRRPLGEMDKRVLSHFPLTAHA